MNKPGLRIVMFVLAVLVATGTAWSDKGEEKKMTKAEMAAAAKVSIEQAIQVASERAVGKVIEAELELEHGRTVWEVEIVTAEGKTVEVHVDADTGQVIDTEGKNRKRKSAKQPKRGN